MEITAGSARFGLWFVQVRWSGTVVYQVRFSRTAVTGPVPVLIRHYLAGRPVDLTAFVSGNIAPGEAYARIYRVVRNIPYGETATYGEIAEQAGTVPRVVGQALRRNPVPLIVPCHRVVSRSGLGGFTPDPEIKVRLLDMEHKAISGPVHKKSI
jgi:methylated-DNA-[protein]-cysteine S-methyltransferase